jgi:hypothetical protein
MMLLSTKTSTAERMMGSQSAPSDTMGSLQGDGMGSAPT